MEPTSPHHPEKHVYIYIVAGVFLTLTMIGIIYVKSVNERSLTYLPTATQITTEPQVLGAMESNFTLKPTTSEMTVGQETTVILAATSANPITGFDALVTVDPSQFDVVSVSATNSGYELFPSKVVGGFVAITGTLQDGKPPTALKNKPVAQITIRAKRAGSFTVNLVSEQSPRHTQLITSDLSVITPEIFSTTLVVK